MSLFRKSAEYTGYKFYHGEKFIEWQCPNKKCGMHVLEDYNFCPYCGQKIKFKEPPKVKMIELKMRTDYKAWREKEG